MTFDIAESPKVSVAPVSLSYEQLQEMLWVDVMWIGLKVPVAVAGFRTSGMRFRYDLSRPRFDAVIAIEIGDLDRGYHAIDITGHDPRLYSLTCPLYAAVIVVAIPKYTKGKLTLAPKNKQGQPLTSRVEALDAVAAGNTPDLLPPPGTVDETSFATTSDRGTVREIKEWQAIMDHLRLLPKGSADDLPTIPLDERAREVRAIHEGSREA